MKTKLTKIICNNCKKEEIYEDNMIGRKDRWFIVCRPINLNYNKKELHFCSAKCIIEYFQDNSEEDGNKNN